MKFMVMVNGKYMVSVEAETACAAEHVILDKWADEINKYQVISGAQAFGSDQVHTKWFWNDYMSFCETISLKELGMMIEEIIGAYDNKDELTDSIAEIAKAQEDDDAEMAEFMQAYNERKAERQRNRAGLMDSVQGQQSYINLLRKEIGLK